MLDRLIGFDTVSRNSNLALIDFVRDYLDDWGVSSTLVPNEDGTKANLYATIGPQDRPGIALSGHTDVVPVDGQDWTSDPFKMREEDGRLYGRGTADMKGFVAVALAMVPEWVEADLQTPVHLCLSYDEEVGCIGVRGLISHLQDLPVRPKACIVGEPTLLEPVIGHKGKHAYRCHVHGKECHSAYAPYGVNAVDAAAEIAVLLKRLARRMREEGPFHHGFDPPHTTVHTGVLHGGTALNIVPNYCVMDFEFRNIPGHDTEPLIEEVRTFIRTELEPDMHKISSDTGITIETRSWISALEIANTAPLTDMARQVTGSNDTGYVSFGTEAGLFQQGGIPTIVCGPGSIDVAHRPDEYIEISQLNRCESVIRGFIERSERL